MNREAIALLWIIREHGSLTLNDLIIYMLSGLEAENPAAFEILAKNIDQHIMTHALEMIEQIAGRGDSSLNLWNQLSSLFIFNQASSALQRLIEAELVLIVGAEQPTRLNRMPGDAVIQTAHNLQSIQTTLGLSLTRIIQLGTAETIEVAPTFGRPMDVSSTKWARIFIAMPFKNELQPIFTDHISKVADDLGVTCKRGDDFFSVNKIMDEVWSSIFYAELCIVDCTGRNPNVFYELGIAHTLGRKTILIAQSLDDVPFDVQHMRVIIYEYTPDGMVAFEEKLRKTIISELGYQGMR